MNPRVYWTTLGLGIGASAIWVAQMGFQSQDRQYQKTLKYMHDGRERGAARMQKDGVLPSSSK